jgi:hypothetical protein
MQTTTTSFAVTQSRGYYIFDLSDTSNAGE